MLTLQQELEELRTTQDNGNGDRPRRLNDVDRKLHDTIAARSGNARLAYEIGRYHTLMQCFREIADRSIKFPQQGVEELLSIVEALTAKYPEAAAAAMLRHIDNVGAAVESVLFQKNEDRTAAIDPGETASGVPDVRP